ncbi:hypothetical protein PI23P_08050 [Polaribacter irgensii 23-P]|uniref:Uncharacterized protein n=1 Tax=Polaribacter irgensii 23-P TaxID=313594 RepID=A4BZG9_9FLAO|nr:hypothetical protein [Polaribacter irgensii]EAR12562.1 hypothetical protein PI23P_08050 [Polaribacter irgensii 23-P]
MKTEFKTEIVETKQPIKVYSIIFGILYLSANFYIFLFDKENHNIYLKYLSIIILLFGAYFIFGESLKKPKVVGVYEIHEKHISIYSNGTENKIELNEIKSIFLKYMGYGSWLGHSIYGNKNFLKIINKNGNEYNFEILLRDKKMKNDFKSVLKNIGINEKFDFTKMNNSSIEF